MRPALAVYLHANTRAAIRRLWDQGWNTASIARWLKIPEAAVYNFLARR